MVGRSIYHLLPDDSRAPGRVAQPLESSADASAHRHVRAAEGVVDRDPEPRMSVGVVVEAVEFESLTGQMNQLFKSAFGQSRLVTGGGWAPCG